MTEMNENYAWREAKDEEAKKRYYTHCVVSYATLEEIEPLLDACKHYAYIYHDKDKPGPHYHIIATFDREKSFAYVRNLVVSEQNTFTKVIISDVRAVLDYFTHKNCPEKAFYDKSLIVYDDEDYWRKRAGTGEAEVNADDEFVDDLIAEDFSLMRMSRKYGRDFIKNMSRYIEARNALLDEMHVERKRMNMTDDEQYIQAIEMLERWHEQQNLLKKEI